MLTTAYALLLYAAAAVLAGGVGWKIVQYARTPAPFKIPTMPAPVSRAGVIMRLAREVVLFESLFRANKWIWLFGWIFHAALLLVLMRHLRYFVEPVWGWIEIIQPFGLYAGFAMAAGLAGLWIRRVGVERIRYISGASDHLMLLLLAAITLSGLGMKYVAPTDIVHLKIFVIGVIGFDWQPMPADPLLAVHLFLVAALMIAFPFSKLLHAPGIFFSPTRNQADDTRHKRHVNPWMAGPEGGSE